MSVTTKKGDDGKTSLYGGERVSKDSIHVELLGELDELCSMLGMAKSFIQKDQTVELIESIQRDLFLIGSEVATQESHHDKLDERIETKHLSMLESEIGRIESRKNYEMDGFCLPGGNPAAASLDVARAVCRRVERRMVTFKRKKYLRNESVLMYLNRLSDLLFVLSRSFEDAPRKK